MCNVGPGIVPGTLLRSVHQHVDFAATWLGLAGIDTPDTMDGKSIVSELVTNTLDPAVLPSVHRHLQRQQQQSGPSHRSTPPATVVPTVRDSSGGSIRDGTAYIEYHGQ